MRQREVTSYLNIVPQCEPAAYRTNTVANTEHDEAEKKSFILQATCISNLNLIDLLVLFFKIDV